MSHGFRVASLGQLLYERCAMGDFNEVSRLLSLPSCTLDDINFHEWSCLATPLHAAAAIGSLSIVKLLIERGGKAMRTVGGELPSDWAATYQHGEVAEYLRTVEPSSTATPSFPLPDIARLQEPLPPEQSSEIPFPASADFVLGKMIGSQGAGVRALKARIDEEVRALPPAPDSHYCSFSLRQDENVVRLFASDLPSLRVGEGLVRDALQQAIIPSSYQQQYHQQRGGHPRGKRGAGRAIR